MPDAWKVWFPVTCLDFKHTARWAACNVPSCMIVHLLTVLVRPSAGTLSVRVGALTGADSSWLHGDSASPVQETTLAERARAVQDRQPLPSFGRRSRGPPCASSTPTIPDSRSCSLLSALLVGYSADKACEGDACLGAGRRWQQGAVLDTAADVDPGVAGEGAWDGGHAGLADAGARNLPRLVPPITL